MTEQVARDIYRIGVVLPGNPLKELNSYFIRGEERDLLIDTGFRCGECREALASGLSELGGRPERLDILLTHLHSDHVGLAREFAGEKGNIYISGRDLKILEKNFSREGFDVPYGRYREEGFPENVLEAVFQSNPAVQYMLDGLDDRFTPLPPGARIQAGGYELTMVSVPGHTPGNTMFWEENSRIMFTGDHILFDISPNITCWAGVEDSLGDYLDSLRLAKKYPVELALPGHRKTGRYKERIDALLLHHERRLEEALSAVRENPGMTAYETAGRMRWRIRSRNWEEFPPPQKWFAVGECIAHLDYLRRRGLLSRERTAGVWRYYASPSCRALEEEKYGKREKAEKTEDVSAGEA